MTRRRARQATPAGDEGEPWDRQCTDCVPPLWIQGGAWAWRAHRHQIHGEDEEPGPCPFAPDPVRRPGRKPWTDAERAEWHARNRARRRGERYTPRLRPPDGTPPRAGTG